MATPINLQFPMRRSPQGSFATNESTLDAIADDLKILLLTNYGERPIHYDFGANLREVIFELQGDDLSQSIEDHIVVAIEKWMPFVNVINIDVQDKTTTPTLRSNEIHVKIEFSVGNLDSTKTLEQKISA